MSLMGQTETVGRVPDWSVQPPTTDMNNSRRQSVWCHEPTSPCHAGRISAALNRAPNEQRKWRPSGHGLFQAKARSREKRLKLLLSSLATAGHEHHGHITIVDFMQIMRCENVIYNN